jgi:hypothetical protein
LSILEEEGREEVDSWEEGLGKKAQRRTLKLPLWVAQHSGGS